MAEQASGGNESNAHLLEELEALSQTLYQSHVSTTARRTASLVLPRDAIPPIPSSADETNDHAYNKNSKSLLKPLSRRMSMSPWRSRAKQDAPVDNLKPDSGESDGSSLFSEESSEKKKGGLWNWKPMRALSHIGMQKISCLFSVEVVSVSGLPSSMNGLRLSVCVRKKETKDGAVHTMPSRVSQGGADFEETLFVKCHVYSTTGSATPLKFDSRPFLIYVFAVDASELDFGRSSVDLSRLIQESAEKNAQGTRIRQWDTNFKLSGKAKGGELAVKLGFQIMEKDGGAGVFSDANSKRRSSMETPKTFSPSIGRKQSKTSFSIPSPKMSGRMQVWTPAQGGSARADSIQGFEELNLDEEPEVVTSIDPETKEEDLDLPDFDVVDKGVEVQKTEVDDGSKEEEAKSESSEVVKEVVHDQFHLTRMTELDSIAQQIKALESIMGEEKEDSEEAQSQRLDADEENVTREFLQLLEEEGENDEEQEGFKNYQLSNSDDKEEDGDQAKVYLPDLGKGLGCIIQTRNGGFLAATNPLDVIMSRKDEPKLAMQISKPFIITSNEPGFELFQQMAAIGFEELGSEILDRMSIEELMDKTPEQIAFEGIASAIIHGRSKEGATSSAARTVAGLKSMASAMIQGRKERIETGIWNVGEEPLSVDELLPFSLQKMEAMAIEALKIQANIPDEEPPFDVSPSITRKSVLDGAVSIDEWVKTPYNQEAVTVAVVIQLHDPVRRYEAVGGAMIGLIQATKAETDKFSDDEKDFKVNSLHLGGMRSVQRGQKRNAWDSEKQRLTAMQWLVAYGLGRGGGLGKKMKVQSAEGSDLLWSLSSRVMADMWLKPMRNPDVKFTKPFLIYVFAVDASELDFGRSSVDLSRLIQESAEKNAQGTRIRQWDTNFKLSGKAKGGELAVKLGFQIMEKDGGAGVFSDANSKRRSSMETPKTFSPSIGRKQSKTSFSIPSPKMSGRMQVWTPAQGGSARADSIQGFEELNLDEEPEVVTSIDPETKEEDLDLPDFDVVDKGVEVQKTEVDDGSKEEEAKSESSEVVKEVVHDQFHLTRMTELDSIAQQIKALESIMGEEKEDSEEAQSQRLDADEENVTREFLQLLEEEGENDEEQEGFKNYQLSNSDDKEEDGDQAKVYLPDLGKGLGCIIQTRNGGFLAATNPLDVIMSRKDEPKLAMQISKPFIITSNEPGFELFQQMAAIGFEELGSEILDRMSIEELMDKTPEQIAFEGIASAIIHGRSKEGATSSAARTVAGLKSMASAMIQGRKERIETGIWNVGEEPLSVDELLPFSLQKMEAMAIEALKIQANIPDEEPPFDVSPSITRKSVLDGAVSIDEWVKTPYNQEAVTVAVVIQLHDPVRRYEAVGGAMIGLIQATKAETDKFSDDEKDFKVNSLHLGGMRSVQRGQKRNAWDSEKQRLTAMQWLVAYGLGRGGGLGKKMKVQSAEGSDLLWSLSSRVMADMWLKPMRNPDVKFTK